MALHAIVEMQSLTGVRTPGATMASFSAIEEKLALTTKPYCMVLAWVVIDVEGVDPAITHNTHLMPMVMYSHQVVSHSSGQLAQGDCVMTGFATYYDHKGIFETVDAIYILLHQGFRKTAHIDTVRAAQ